MNQAPSPELDRLLKLVRSVAWNPHSSLPLNTQRALRNALDAYEKRQKRPTVFARLLQDELFEGDPGPDKPVCKQCGGRFTGSRKKLFCSSECRNKHWKEKQKAEREAQA